MTNSTNRFLNDKLKCTDCGKQELPQTAIYLGEMGFPTILISVDGSEKIESDQLYQGRLNFEDYKQSNGEDLSLLEDACECGDYESLEEYAFLLIDQIRNETLPHVAREELLKKIHSDLDRVCHLYWSAGYFLACRILREVGNIYLDKYHDEEDSVLIAQLLFEESVECYFNAYRLYKYEEPSKTLVKILYNIDDAGEKEWQEMTAADEKIIAELSQDERHRLFNRSGEALKKILKNNSDIGIHLNNK